LDSFVVDFTTVTGVRTGELGVLDMCVSFVKGDRQ